jgi:hypothetical protein
MWSRYSQATRLVRLREAARTAMGGMPPFVGRVALTLTIVLRSPSRRLRRQGDLDAYIAGVCDGLMAATPTTRLHALWADPALQTIHPFTALAIRDDSQIVRILAEKIVGDGSAPWYEISIEEMRTEDRDTGLGRTQG